MFCIDQTWKIHVCVSASGPKGAVSSSSAALANFLVFEPCKSNSRTERETVKSRVSSTVYYIVSSAIVRCVYYIVSSASSTTSIDTDYCYL